ncbi:MAG: hypothetical protein MI919_19475, partial [Holophagales bacterium]|nr:hypothetical protein [Holophagales bacterium]
GGGNERHYHADQVGTSRLITGHNGLEVFTAPYGAPIGGITSGERSVGFQGHETDGALTYMRGRHYYPGAGRFIQVDPARDDSVWSLYAFGADNPLRYRDPTGRNPAAKPLAVKAFETIVALLGALGAGEYLADKADDYVGDAEVDNIAMLREARESARTQRKQEERRQRALRKSLETFRKSAEGGDANAKKQEIRLRASGVTEESAAEELEASEQNEQRLNEVDQALTELILELQGVEFPEPEGREVAPE